mmetsp:Transcript_98161/g.233629  ORF Transcript_98161/g.233629 Transcript_98161/m.233629 type:complete len:206 (+) Transcript_98161:527-1144(+)
MCQPGRELGHGLVAHAALGGVRGHGGPYVVQAQGVLLPQVRVDPLQRRGLPPAPLQLCTRIRRLPWVQRGVVGATHQRLHIARKGVRLGPAHGFLLKHGRLRGAHAAALHAFAEGGVGVEGASGCRRVEAEVVVVVQLEAPKQAQRAAVPSQHLVHLTLHSQLLRADLPETEDAAHREVGAELFEALPRAATPGVEHMTLCSEVP